MINYLTNSMAAAVLFMLASCQAQAAGKIDLFLAAPETVSPATAFNVDVYVCLEPNNARWGYKLMEVDVLVTWDPWLARLTGITPGADLPPTWTAGLPKRLNLWFNDTYLDGDARAVIKGTYGPTCARRLYEGQPLHLASLTFTALRAGQMHCDPNSANYTRVLTERPDWKCLAQAVAAVQRTGAVTTILRAAHSGAATPAADGPAEPEPAPEANPGAGATSADTDTGGTPVPQQGDNDGSPDERAIHRVPGRAGRK